MNNNDKRKIMLDNYKNPRNMEKINDDEYLKFNSRNVSCIDNIDLYIKIKNNIIDDLKFDGEACVIAISSTSIMTELLKNKTLDEALEIIYNYENMINGLEYNEKILGEANVYDEIYKQPSRKICATLSWIKLKEEIEKNLHNKGK